MSDKKTDSRKPHTMKAVAVLVRCHACQGEGFERYMTLTGPQVMRRRGCPACLATGQITTWQWPAVGAGTQIELPLYPTGRIPRGGR